mmetsp:Transcript_18461/g.52754  ORF Transcript_18461/g.52754 Transcript_18461/m.52754 type:complete len:356 (+) Transcript_18461:562-1629(+)
MIEARSSLLAQRSRSSTIGTRAAGLRICPGFVAIILVIFFIIRDERFARSRFGPPSTASLLQHLMRRISPWTWLLHHGWRRRARGSIGAYGLLSVHRVGIGGRVLIAAALRVGRQLGLLWALGGRPGFERLSGRHGAPASHRLGAAIDLLRAAAREHLVERLLFGCTTRGGGRRRSVAAEDAIQLADLALHLLLLVLLEPGRLFGSGRRPGGRAVGGGHELLLDHRLGLDRLLGDRLLPVQQVLLLAAVHAGPVQRIGAPFASLEQRGRLDVGRGVQHRAGVLVPLRAVVHGAHGGRAAAGGGGRSRLGRSNARGALGLEDVAELHRVCCVCVCAVVAAVAMSLRTALREFCAGM